MAARTFTEADFPVGTVAHQGDLILVRLAEFPKSAMARKSRQLAIGNTQGARHLLTVGAAFDAEPAEVAAAIMAICRAEVQPEYVGPVFRTTGGKASVVHPEHGDHHYVGDMVIACIYQRNLDAEEREQRVQD